MKIIKIKGKQFGFTLVEILVAVSIFSTFILITTSTLSNVIRSERRMGVARSTQENGRYILDSIVREARGANGELDAGGVRINHAFSVTTDNHILTIITTDLEANLVRRSQYMWNSTNKALTKQSDSKTVTPYTNTYSNSTVTVVAAPTGTSNPGDTIVTNFFVEIPINPTDKTVPQEVKLSIEAQNRAGAVDGIEDMAGKTEIETSVSSRNY